MMNVLLNLSPDACFIPVLFRGTTFGGFLENSFRAQRITTIQVKGHRVWFSGAEDSGVILWQQNKELAIKKRSE